MSDKPKPDRTRKLVSAAYGVALDPGRFDDLLSSWDNWFHDVANAGHQAFAEVSADFEDALQISDRLANKEAEQDPLERLTSAAILIDATGEALALNSSAQSLLNKGELSKEHVLREARSASGLCRVGGGAAGRSYLAMTVPASAVIVADYPEAKAIVLISAMVWTQSFEAELADRLGLSTAELRVARGLMDGRTAQEVAGELGRSLPTIRSHIKVMLEKTGARRQTELVQLLTILRQAFEGAQSKSAARIKASGFSREQLSGPAGFLDITTYGAGTPLLYFTTSSCPWESAAVRQGFAEAGFRVIAPARPGFGGSTAVDGDASDALLDHWLSLLLERAGPAPTFAGHREGGLLAARAAKRAVSMGFPVSGLALISSGAPVRDLSQFEKVPKSTRRTLLAGQIAKPALRLGYEAAARYFRAGPAGEEKFVRFFCRDNAADQVLISDPAVFQTLRDNLRYCFESPGQIAKDVSAWGRDWSADLQKIMSLAPVLFAHGTEHDFLPMEAVEEACASNCSAYCLPVEGAGQLALYVTPKKIGTTFHQLLRQS